MGLKDKFTAWLQLVRLPNLVTVPGDPLAGFLLALSSLGVLGEVSYRHVWPCLAASLLLYMAGLVLNDVADYDEDKRLRPDRPLPSGAISRKAALIAALLLGVGGIGSAALAGLLSMITAGGLVLLIVLYNFYARKIPFLGIVVMGMCRGVSLLLGASVVGVMSPIVIAAACGLSLYIVAVSCAALREAEGRPAKGVGWLPAAALVLIYSLFILRFGVNSSEALLMAFVSVGWTVMRAIALARSEKAVSKEIGLMIRGLLLVQAFFCEASGIAGSVAVICLLLLWPVAIVCGRKFYSS